MRFGGEDGGETRATEHGCRDRGWLYRDRGWLNAVSLPLDDTPATLSQKRLSQSPVGGWTQRALARRGGSSSPVLGVRLAKLGPGESEWRVTSASDEAGAGKQIAGTCLVAEDKCVRSACSTVICVFWGYVCISLYDLPYSGTCHEWETAQNRRTVVEIAVAVAVAEH